MGQLTENRVLTLTPERSMIPAMAFSHFAPFSSYEEQERFPVTRVKPSRARLGCAAFISTLEGEAGSHTLVERGKGGHWELHDLSVESFRK